LQTTYEMRQKDVEAHVLLYATPLKHNPLLYKTHAQAAPNDASNKSSKNILKSPHTFPLRMVNTHENKNALVIFL
jgi:hypothetical protein